MAIDWDRFEALTFDCYGTLIDWESGILAALRVWAAKHALELDDGALLAAFAEAESAIEAAQPKLPYPDVLRATQRALAMRFGVAPNFNDDESLGTSVRDWPVFPDSPAALAYLKRHYRLVIVSNVDRGSFAYSNRKLGVEFDSIVTAQDVGSYKPNPAHFHEAFKRLDAMGIPRSRILHVAQSLFHDHVPGKDLGMTTLWINRRAGKRGWGATAPPPTPVTPVTPDAEYPDMAAFAAAHRAGRKR
ncbi:MAG: haloacid dehalogenase type II [Roseiarcus sp.]